MTNDQAPKFDPGIQYTAYLEGSLVLSARGQWFHNGEPFKNPRLSDLFHRAIIKDETLGRYVVRLPPQQATFEYEDCVFFVETIGTEGDVWSVTLNTGATQPLRDETLTAGSEGQIYCRLASGERARFSRAAHQFLLEHAESETSIRIGTRSVPLRSET